MTVDWITVFANLLGTSFVVALINLGFNWHQNNVQRDFEARRDAKDYYLPLYGHIAKLDELARGYSRSLNTGYADVFDFDNATSTTLSSDDILSAFKKAYLEFSKFYITKKSCGYELFISEKLRDSLTKYWCAAQDFYDDVGCLKVPDNVNTFHNLAENVTVVTEKLFGLK
jgi:hypothetical protein